MIKWENIANGLFRLRVPGGWLVKISEDVLTHNSFGETEFGYEWRSSICFYPDPEYLWLPEKDLASSTPSE